MCYFLGDDPKMKRFTVPWLLILTSLGFLSAALLTPGAAAKGPQTSEGARRITPADLRELIKKNQAIVVDVRSEEAYKAGHIKGARSIPASEIGNRAGELPRDKLIATYCS